MSNSVYEVIEKNCKAIGVSLSSTEIARLAAQKEFNDEALNAVDQVFEYLAKKQTETTIHTLLKMSRLPLKNPKTFENFDFSTFYLRIFQLDASARRI